MTLVDWMMRKLSNADTSISIFHKRVHDERTKGHISLGFRAFSWSEFQLNLPERELLLVGV